jgi:hypothetical protein
VKSMAKDNPVAPKQQKPKRKGLRSVEIERADNGVVMHKRYETDGDGYDPGDKTVHEGSLDDFVSNMFNGGDAKSRRISAAMDSMKGKTK